jgi:hypothetical protein
MGLAPVKFRDLAGLKTGIGIQIYLFTYNVQMYNVNVDKMSIFLPFFINFFIFLVLPAKKIEVRKSNNSWFLILHLAKKNILFIFTLCLLSFLRN